jgi:hypothetical protein
MRLAMQSAPNAVVSFPALAICAALALCPCAASAALPIQPGMWELRVTTTVAKQAAPAETSRECLSQQEIDHPTRTLPKPAADCSISNIETNGSRVAYDLSCRKDEVVIRGRTELVVGTTSYDGMADMKLNAPGKVETPMTAMLNARRIGDCPK